MENKRQIYIGAMVLGGVKEEALRVIGLSDKEIKIYLASLEMGPSLVQAIAKRASLNRTSCYDLLSLLEAKGLVSFVIKSGKKIYQATDPNKLLGLLKEKEGLIQKALPELRRIKGEAIKKPSIFVYTGKEGSKSIFEDILKENKDFLCLASKIHLSKLFRFYFPHFVKRRIKQGIKIKLLTDVAPYDKTADYKIIKKKFKTAIFVYGTKLAMISLEEKEPVGILIEEKNLVGTQEMMFNLVWKGI